ncbi:MAG: hypothetical protein ACMUEM_04240 [Flavobacteriales bacterium AspAUS03]
MTTHENLAYFVINNSGKIYVINTKNFKVVESITKLHTVPYIHFINEEKTYVASGFIQKINIIHPKTITNIGSIHTYPYNIEQMVYEQGQIFINPTS